MFIWNIEELRLMNDEKKTLNSYWNSKVYSFENSISREDKIAFMDAETDGKVSYILELSEKFEQDKDTMPKDKWGDIKTVSLNAWIKRNDTRGVCESDGKIFLFKTCRKINKLNKNMAYDAYSDCVDEFFHRLLNIKEDLEKEWFNEHDEYSVLKKQLKGACDKYNTTFGVMLTFCSSGEINVSKESEEETNRYESRPITIEEIKILLVQYEKLESYIKQLSDEIHIVYERKE